MTPQGFVFGRPTLEGQGEPGGFGFGGRVESAEIDRAPTELREVSERREQSSNDRPIPEPRLKARKIRFEFFEALTFKSIASGIGTDVVGAVGDDSLEGQMERWRTTKPVNATATVAAEAGAGEKEFHDYEYRFDGSVHYLFIRYTE